MADEAFLREARAVHDRGAALEREIESERRSMEAAARACTSGLDTTREIAERLREHAEVIGGWEVQGRTLLERLVGDEARLSVPATHEWQPLDALDAGQPIPVATRSPQTKDVPLSEPAAVTDPLAATPEPSPFAVIWEAMEAQMSTLAQTLETGLREAGAAVARTESVLGERAPQAATAPERQKEKGPQT